MSLTLKAITEIHRTIKPGVAADKNKGIPPKAPEVQIIKPGAVFEARSKDEYDDLKKGPRPAAHPYKAGAVAPMTEEEGAKVVRAISGGSTVKTPEPVEPEEDEDEDEDERPDEAALTAMTKAKIVAQGKAEGLDLIEDGNTKADLVKAIMDARPASDLL